MSTAPPIPSSPASNTASGEEKAAAPALFPGPTMLPFILIVLANIGGYLHLLPVFVQLLVNSCACVYLGTIMSTKLRKSSGDGIEIEAGKDKDKIGQKQAMKFPIVASAFLLSFYLIYKYISQTLVNTLLTIQFSIATIISTSSILQQSIRFSNCSRKTITHVNPPKLLKNILEIDQFDISKASILCTLIVSVPVVLYCVTKYWALNNIFGVLFAIMALRNIDLDSFKVGFLLLWFLFFYDIFWVYGTDVMVTVAKKLDIPIKLLFPYLKAEGTEAFSMLGLGDIVIPGIFISLCLKYDIDTNISKKIKKITELKLPYFYTSFIGYVVGICATFAAMYIFDHAQPALLFLVPTCTLSVLGLSFMKGEVDKMSKYETSPQKKQEEGKKQENQEKKEEKKN